MANRYWVGGTASWDATAGSKWSTTSGGAGGSAVPTTSDAVIIDNRPAPKWAASTNYALGAIVSPLATANGYYYEATADAGSSGGSEPTWPTVVGNTVVDSGITWTCRLATVTLAASGSALSLNFTGFIGTWTGTSSITGGLGNVTLGSGMTYSHTGTLTFGVVGTITSNGVVFTSSFNFSSGHDRTLGDNLTVTRSNTTGIFQRTGGGAFNANGKTVTINGSLSQLSHPTYPFTGTSSFYNLTLNGDTGANVGIGLSGDIRASNAMVINGNSRRYQYFIKSYIEGTQRTITAVTSLTVANADFSDIIGAGVGWNLSAQTDIGDCDNNSGITFPTGTTCYWKHGGTQNDFWDSANWYTTSGGSTPIRQPLIQDTARFDNGSFSTTTRKVTIRQYRIGIINCSGVTNSPNLELANSVDMYRDVTLGSSMSSTGAYNVTYKGRRTSTFTSNGTSTSWAFIINSPSNIFQMGDALTTTSGSSSPILLSNGTFRDGGFTLTTPGFTLSGSATRTIDKTGNWVINGNIANIFNATTVTNLTVTNLSGEIKFTGTLTANRTFQTGGLTYSGTVWNATSGAFALIFAGAGTFGTFKTNSSRTNTFTSNTITTAAAWIIDSCTLSSTAASPNAVIKNTGAKVNVFNTTSTDVDCQATGQFAKATGTTIGDGINWDSYSSARAGNLFFGSNF